jgi:hypothetical protein
MRRNGQVLGLIFRRVGQPLPLAKVSEVRHAPNANTQEEEDRDNEEELENAHELGPFDTLTFGVADYQPSGSHQGKLLASAMVQIQLDCVLPFDWCCYLLLFNSTQTNSLFI